MQWASVGHHKFDMMALNSIREGTFITWGGTFFLPAWGGVILFFDKDGGVILFQAEIHIITREVDAMGISVPYG